VKKKAPSLREFFHRFTVMIQEAMAKFTPQNDAHMAVMCFTGSACHLI